MNNSWKELLAIMSFQHKKNKIKITVHVPLFIFSGTLFCLLCHDAHVDVWGLYWLVFCLLTVSRGSKDSFSLSAPRSSHGICGSGQVTGSWRKYGSIQVVYGLSAQDGTCELRRCKCVHVNFRSYSYGLSDVHIWDIYIWNLARYKECF